MKFAGLSVAVLAVLVSACGGKTPPVQSTADLQVLDQSVGLPPPTVRDLADQSRETVLGPNDRISVSVFGVPDAGGTVRADSTGRIALPLAGEININGKTTREVEQALAEAYARSYIRNPRVTVNIVELVSQQVTVDGEVAQPGLYPVVGDMTLLRAIASARGTTEFARLSHVVVFREVDQKRLAALYDVRAIRSGLYQDPKIYPNDVIVVGTSQARRIFRDVLQSSGLITTPIIALLQA
jgi:polysaccharide biosynthesis/export protein